MSQTPLSVESEAKLQDLYAKIVEQYFVQDKRENFIGFKSLEVSPSVLSPRSSCILEVELKCAEILDFLHKYKDHFMWFKGSSKERITAEDRHQSKYRPLWLLLDNFMEDSARQYQRLFNVDALFGMFEEFDVCSTGASLRSSFCSSVDNYKIACVINFGTKPLQALFINYPELEIKSNCLYLFPSSFTHSFTYDFADEDLLIFLGGFA